MKIRSAHNNDIVELEALLLKHFREEPFHNLYLLYGKEPLPHKYGGTCSDKTLSFIDAACALGFDAKLHTGAIGGKEIHRLVCAQIGNRTFFADVGNGWPSLKLYPTDEEISYSCFGMKYRTCIADNKISVFHTRNRKEYLQLVIDIRPREEKAIKEDIDIRFTSGITYPFSNSLRFSLIVNNKFLFLRGDRLEIYSDNEFLEVSGIEKESLPWLLEEKFEYKSSNLFEYLVSV
ncbi:arylamine N-acetyltransferase [Agarivorans sp. QJM3NY_33]|uniref:arylamine N-acetyltransferase n=1 Tax=Agarivorans sp. QJM3NY_33 TaxID=3421432 RepID=UPI003D7E179A